MESQYCSTFSHSAFLYASSILLKYSSVIVVCPKQHNPHKKKVRIKNVCFIVYILDLQKLKIHKTLIKEYDFYKLYILTFLFQIFIQKVNDFICFIYHNKMSFIVIPEKFCFCSIVFQLTISSI